MHRRVSPIMVTLRQRQGTVGNKRRTMKFDDRTRTVDPAIDSTRRKGRETKREKREFPVWSARGPQEGKWPRAACVYVCRESVVKNAGGGKGASDIFSGGEGPPRASINATPSVIWLGDNGFEHVRAPLDHPRAKVHFCATNGTSFADLTPRGPLFLGSMLGHEKRNGARMALYRVEFRFQWREGAAT